MVLLGKMKFLRKTQRYKNYLLFLRFLNNDEKIHRYLHDRYKIAIQKVNQRIVRPEVIVQGNKI